MASNRRRLASCGLVTVFAISLGGCFTGLYGNDEYERYTQRHDAVTMSAGDAKAVNAVTHMIHPWPRYVFDRQISVNGERLARAVERYRKGPPAQTGAGTSSATVQVMGTAAANSK
jgi:hypothetical protein